MSAESTTYSDGDSPTDDANVGTSEQRSETPSLSNDLTSLLEQARVKRKGNLQIPRELFDIARDRLAALRKESDEEDTDEEGDPLEVIVTDNIPGKLFMKFCERERDLPVRLCLVDGTLIATELPIYPHGGLQGAFAFVAAGWNAQIPAVNNHLAFIGPTDMYVGTNSTRSCDGGFQPLRRRRPPAGRAANQSGEPYPSLVIEVGCSESLASLERKAHLYFAARTSIQLYLAVKAGKIRRANTRQVVALLYRRSSANPVVPTIAVSFGSAPIFHRTVQALTSRGVPATSITGLGRAGAPACNNPGMALYQINIPANELYNDVPGGPPAGITFVLDLWVIKHYGMLR